MKTKPYNRHETFLAALSDSSITVPDPLSREELYLAKIAGESVTVPAVPYNRYETFLAKIAGENVTVPTPASRLEYFLYKACGYDCDEPVPVNREEVFWKRYIGSESSGSTVTITDAAAGSPRAFVISLTPNQPGTGDPSPSNVRPISAWTGYIITQVTSESSIMYSDSFATDVYAGSFDGIQGKLTRTHTYIDFDGTESIAASSYSKYASIPIGTDAPSITSGATGHDGWCSHYVVREDIAYATYMAEDNIVTYCDSNISSRKAAHFRDNVNASGSTKAEATAKYINFVTAQNTAGTPLQLVYRLGSPSEASMTPPGITLAAGENTFTCNCGTITIKYTPDL